LDNFIQKLVQQFKEVWGRLNPWQKGLLVGIPTLLFAGMLAFILLSSKAHYEVLYSHLEEKDAAEVTAEQKRKYSLSHRFQRQFCIGVGSVGKSL
jgi:flagellar biosynthesis/type III secretory pathway M-ring protein FliF/YscJ